MSTDGNSPEDDRKRKFAADCFKKATEAMAKQNWDYAIEMFGVASKMIPSNVAYRQNLRGVTGKKYNNNGTGRSMAFLAINSVRSKVKKAKTAKNWAEMDAAAEEGLLINPWDAQFNADLGEASKERGHMEIAMFAYEQAVNSAKENKEFLIALADVYEERGDYDRAVTTLERVAKLDPLNGAIRSKIQGVATKKVIDRGGYEGAGNTKDVKTDVKKGYEASVTGGASKQNEVLAPGESVENDLQRAIRKDPSNEGNYQKLAEHYRREGDLDKAVKQYELYLNIKPDPNIREQMEDVQLEMVRKNLLFAKEAALSNPSDEMAKKNSAELAKELRDQEIEIFSRRTERYPNDMKLKNELALRFMQADKVALAIPLFQQASTDVRLEATVLVNLGVCFLKQKQNSLASRQFSKALEKLNPNDQKKPFLDCHYWLGRLAEEAKDYTKAETHYIDIIGLDYSFRDVGARLEKIQKEMGKGAEGDGLGDE